MRESPTAFALRLVAQGTRPEDIRELARQAGLDVRRVRLREPNWWRHAVLPGIAFRTADRSPLALLPSGLGYRHLTRETAALLDPDAWLFSERMPAGVKSLRELVLWALYREKATLALMAAGGILSAFAAGEIPSASGFARAGFLTAAIVFLQLVRSSAGLRLAGKLSMSLVPGFWGRILRAGSSCFDATRPEEIALAGQSIAPVCVAVSADSVEFATACLTAIAVAFVLIARCGNAGVAVGFTALLLAVSRLLLRYFETAVEETAEAAERSNSGIAWLVVLDLLKLRLLAAADRLAARYIAAHRDAVRQRHRQFALDVCRRVLAAVTPAALLLPAALLAPNSRLTLSYLAGAALLTWSLHRIDDHSPGVFRIAVAARRVTPFLAAETELEVPAKRGLRLRGAIRLESVSFAWPGSDTPALDDVSLSIEPGEFVCLAGPSGSGKSTLLRLLLGLERPSHGEIVYDGEPLTGLDVETARSCIELISQEERLADGTVRMNILGSSPGSLDDAWKAAGIAGIDDAIRAMPLGMTTFANEQVFSNGERQRLFIARAIVNRPAILILDETLSGLDENLQSRIVANLRNIPGMTCIVVSHRPSLAAIMDRTWRFDRGRIVGTETGRRVRMEPTQTAPPPAALPIFLPEAVERFHAPEPLDRMVRLWPC